MLRHVFQNEFHYAEGFRRLDEPDGELLARAEEIAAHSDCVLLYLGLPEGFETEGLDREHMRIHDNQRVLLERLHQVNPRIIVVMSAGSAVEMPWIEQCQALLWAGLGGRRRRKLFCAC